MFNFISRLLAIAACLAPLIHADPLAAAVQARISHAGGLGSTQGSANRPMVAYNPNLGQAMVVWFGFDSQLPGGTARSIIAG